MAANYVLDGVHIDYTCTGTVSSGQVLLIGARIGIALKSGVSGNIIAVRMQGIFTIAKHSTDVVAQGALLYWDNTNSRLTTTAAGHTLAGFASIAAGSGVTTVECSINA